MASDITVELRAEVARRAEYRCEYCGIHEHEAGFAHQVDHIISRKHGGSSASLNLAYACLLYNRYKGTDLASIDPESGEPVRLFHPRRDLWTDHFLLESHRVVGLSGPGRATVQVLRLNAPERIAERKLIAR